MDPSARKINSAKFQYKKVSVLIVTDVAARGIDIPSLDYVINVHFPGKPKLFVHRVGKFVIGLDGRLMLHTKKTVFFSQVVVLVPDVKEQPIQYSQLTMKRICWIYTCS